MFEQVVDVVRQCAPTSIVVCRVLRKHKKKRKRRNLELTHPRGRG